MALIETDFLVGSELELYDSGGGPVVVLIHGHGTSKRSFTDPLGESLTAREPGREKVILSYDFLVTRQREENGSLYRMGRGASFFLESPARIGAKCPSLYSHLKERGFRLLTWSQRFNNDTVERSFEELEFLIDRFIPEKFPGAGVAFVTHSRGGLLARLMIQRKHFRPTALVQIAPPNHGSRAATLARLIFQGLGFLSPGHSTNKGGILSRVGEIGGIFLGREFSRRAARFFNKFRDNLSEYAESLALRELSPGSPLIEELARGEARERTYGVPLFQIFGDRVHFNTLFHQPEGGEPRRLIDFLETFATPFSPSEGKSGHGDGCVAIKRGRLDWAREVEILSLNHASILGDARVNHRVSDFLEKSL